VSWSDANLSNEPSEALSKRIGDLENIMNSQLSELRAEVGLAAAAMRSSGGVGGSATPLGDLEEQLARAVTISLSAALEAIRESLTEVVADAVAQLAFRIETVIASQPQAPAPRPQWSATDLDDVATSLQHSVMLALSSFEQSIAHATIEPSDAPATVRDVALVNQRIDELRSQLLG
jgi:sulfur carrier protein ThiS